MTKFRNLPPTPEPVEIIEPTRNVITHLENCCKQIDSTVRELQERRRYIQGCIMRLKRGTDEDDRA